MATNSAPMDRVILAAAGDKGLLKPPEPVPGAFDASRDYVTIKIVSYWQPTLDSPLDVLRPRHGALHMRLSAGVSGAEDVDQRTFVSPEFLGQFSKARLNRVKQHNLLALGPVVYRPDLKLEIGLFSVQSDERVMGMLSMLNRLAESASLPRVQEAIPFAKALGDGLDVVLGFKDGLRLEVGLGQGIGDHSPAGTYALIFNEDDQVVIEKLSIRTGGALIHGRKGKHLQRPHIVFELCKQQSREDWIRLPDLRAGWLRVREAASSDQASEALDAALRSFRRQVLLSPDLTPADARRIDALIREKMGDLRATYEAAGGGGTLDPGPLEGLGGASDSGAEDDWRPESAEAPTYNTTIIEFPALSTYDKGYQDVMAFLLKAEGGKADLKNDLGGRTNLGITQKTLNDWRVSRKLPALDVFDITQEEAIAIYFENYWRPASCAEAKDARLALVMLDTAVLCGTARPIRFLQMALLRYLDVKRVNRTKLDDKAIMAFVDGRFGPLTQETLERARGQDGIPHVIASFLALRAGFHRTKVIETTLERHQGQFIGGWLNRLSALHTTALGAPPDKATYAIWAPANVGGRFEGLADDSDSASDASSSSGGVMSVVEEFTLDFDDDGVDDDDAAPEGIQPVESLALERYALDRYRLSLHESLAITRNPDGLMKALKDQRNARRFDKLHLGSMVARFKGHPSLALRNLEIQALNEFKQFDEARALALDVIRTSEPEIDKNPEARQAWVDAYGHLGRTCKQEYVDWARENPDQPPGEAQHKYLLEALAAYGAPFRRFGEACLWHGINVVALLARGREDGVPFPPNTPDHVDLATKIIASVDARAAKLVQLSKAGAKLDDAQKHEKAYLEGERAWDLATSAEAHVAIGKFGKARRLYAEFLTASIATARATKSFEAFSLESAFRQLDEVWRLGGKKSPPQAKSLLTSVKLAMARAPGTQVTFNREEAAHLVANPLESASDDLLEAQSSAFEAVHDGYSVLPAVAWHERFREVMCAIARIDLNRRGVDGKRAPRGSGFLIDGGELRDSWKGLTLFMTNAHVVYPEPDKFGGQVRPIKPESAVVTFTVSEPDKEYRIKRVLWQSRHHDVVICELDRATAIKPLTGIELDLPSADEAFEITVVGHPGGREMSFAPSNLKLHRHDGPDAEKSGRPVLLHYRASTEPGNSGSPAFNWRTMRLIGVHHAGRGSVLEYRPSQGKVQRIDRGTADINEAIAICSIRQALGRAK